MINVNICHIEKDGDMCMSDKIIYDKEKVYDIMDTTQCNYANEGVCKINGKWCDLQFSDASSNYDF